MLVGCGQGVHAQYSVWLEDVRPAGAAAAFTVAPSVGYQRQTFVMSTVDHALLDFEEPPFQHIELKFIAQEVSEPTHVGEATIHIYLENWNDELPIFDESLYEVRFDETEGEGFYVDTVRARDRDIGDRVVHTLMGNANDFLTIDEYTGEIHVLNNNSFDYHRQNELFVQVRADDTLMPPYHTTTTQLLIRLNDINNTPPTLRLPRSGPRVQENEPAGHPVTDEITASDPDTTAHLQFSIDWEQSYATKQGRDADAEEYYGCVEIETVFRGESRGEAYGRLVVREIRPGVTIDYEMFDMLYLVVRVVDLNTVLNEDSDERKTKLLRQFRSRFCRGMASPDLVISGLRTRPRLTFHDGSAGSGCGL
ncbi:Neural-cadherin [Eumeta japonica]|uniref:Neural-cadherin n=1 Tax=Eumeta variegata TaxID=151549 RepID=A0A4C1YTJ6_EUMVA|nr:Neural-cadherin [Eumeta japonica]